MKTDTLYLKKATLDKNNIQIKSLFGNNEEENTLNPVFTFIEVAIQ